MWSRVIDQERVVRALQGAVERGRVGHAYLFHGPDGTGKRAVALAFASALLCGQARGACSDCPACDRVQRLVHPDVRLLFPQPTDAKPDDVAERLRLLGQDPYATVDYQRRPSLSGGGSAKQAFYAIDRVHDELLRPMSYKPVEGRYKVALVTDAHLLRPEGANAFLKVLEEPAPQTLFVLTTPRPERLLPTIRSRCQALRFDPLPAEAIERALVERTETEPRTAAPIARMADGSYSRALELLADEDLMEQRHQALELLRMAYVRRPDKVSPLIEQVQRQGRDAVRGLLQLVLLWVRDLVQYRHRGDDAELVNVDQRQAVQRFVEGLPDADLDAMARLVEEAHELVGRNVLTQVVLVALVQALGRAMRGKAPGGLYRPLTASAHAA